MEDSTVKKLKFLADKYETHDFIKNDPSQFLWWYTDKENAETASFIAALLSFGSRTQFIPKIEYILKKADFSGGINNWIKTEKYLNDFMPGDKTETQKFYRFYSYHDMFTLFDALRQILNGSESLENIVRKNFETSREKIPDILAELFPECSIVPKGKTSAKKRLCMFARWMVRTDSCVDRGFWYWASKADLIIPLDVHVLKEAINLNLLEPATKPTRKTAENLTEIMKQIWPDDPLKGDFALFGLGVDKNTD